MLDSPLFGAIVGKVKLEAKRFFDIQSKFETVKKLSETNEEVKIGLWSMAISGFLFSITAGIALYNKEADHPEIIILLSGLGGIAGVKTFLNGLENYKPKL